MSRESNTWENVCEGGKERGTQTSLIVSLRKKWAAGPRGMKKRGHCTSAWGVNMNARGAWGVNARRGQVPQVCWKVLLPRPWQNPKQIRGISATGSLACPSTSAAPRLMPLHSAFCSHINVCT